MTLEKGEGDSVLLVCYFFLQKYKEGWFLNFFESRTYENLMNNTASPRVNTASPKGTQCDSQLGCTPIAPQGFKVKRKKIIPGQKSTVKTKIKHFTKG